MTTSDIYQLYGAAVGRVLEEAPRPDVAAEVLRHVAVVSRDGVPRDGLADEIGRPAAAVRGAVRWLLSEQLVETDEEGEVLWSSEDVDDAVGGESFEIS